MLYTAIDIGPVYGLVRIGITKPEMANCHIVSRADIWTQRLSSSFQGFTVEEFNR